MCPDRNRPFGGSWADDKMMEDMKPATGPDMSKEAPIMPPETWSEFAEGDKPKADLPQRLLDACVGHPFAKIPWPHRILHEAVKRIAELEQERDTALAENARYREAHKLVAKQAKDEGLWFVPNFITEDYLQQELRKLHAIIEGKSPEQCAIEALEAKHD